MVMTSVDFCEREKICKFVPEQKKLIRLLGQELDTLQDFLKTK